MKIVLPAVIVLFCALIGYNASVASRNLRTIKDNASQRLEASDVQAAITAVDLDLHAIETGQRGYLLTGDESYLAPFTQAIANLPVHFSDLRSRLAARPEDERAVEKQLESVASDKIADANETIRLRQKGYRHRAFVLVDSNRGEELMDKARSLLASMSATESANAPHYQQAFAESVASAQRRSMLASVAILALTVLALVLFSQSRRRVQVAYEKQTIELRSTTAKLDRLNRAVSGDIRSTLSDLQSCAENLQRIDGGFLPRTGQEKVQWMYDASLYVNRLLDDLCGNEKTGSEGSRGKRAAQTEAVTAATPHSRTA